MNILRSKITKLVFLFSVVLLCQCGSSGSVTPPTPTDLKMFFLHHSVGRNLLNEGSVRATITAYNTEHDTDYELWDHDYNAEGLYNGSGVATGTNYAIPGDNTNPDGLYALWTNADDDWTASRDQIMSAVNDYDVIAFKSCYIALDNLTNAAELEEWQNWYLDMRDYFDDHTDKLFVVMPPPPLIEADTTAANAALARQFADWLSSDTYLSGHPNVVCFDLFDYFAGADNFLLNAYESDDASHPNALGNETVGPIFANFLSDSANAYFE